MNKYDGLPSRPDKHVVVTIAIPLLQVSWGSFEANVDVTH